MTLAARGERRQCRTQADQATGRKAQEEKEGKQVVDLVTSSWQLVVAHQCRVRVHAQSCTCSGDVISFMLDFASASR